MARGPGSAPAGQDLGGSDLQVGEKGESRAPAFSPSPRDPEARGSGGRLPQGCPPWPWPVVLSEAAPALRSLLPCSPRNPAPQPSLQLPETTGCYRFCFLFFTRRQSTPGGSHRDELKLPSPSRVNPHERPSHMHKKEEYLKARPSRGLAWTWGGGNSQEPRMAVPSSPNLRQFGSA